MSKMVENAKNYIVASMIELLELKEDRKQLIKGLEWKGKCIVSNKEVQNLNDVIESLETSKEMAMQYIRNASKEEQPN